MARSITVRELINELMEMPLDDRVCIDIEIPQEDIVRAKYRISARLDILGVDGCVGLYPYCRVKLITEDIEI